MRSPSEPSGASVPEGSSFSFRRELARKALHLATGIVPVSLHFGVDRDLLLSLFGATTGVAFGVELARHAHASTAARFDRWFGHLLRPHERHAITGATWLSLSVFLALWWLPAGPAAATIWCATLGDPAAALVGRALSTQSGGKTWAGSLACAVVSALGMWWLAPLSPTGALGLGLAAALAERLPLPVDDNLRITLTTGALLAFFA